MPNSFEAFLREQGLEPLSWEDVLLRIEQKLTTSEAETFKRLHRAFTAYPTPHTARGFYDFSAEHELLPLLAGFRFDRLASLGAALAPSLDPVPAGLRVLDVGAGGGWLAAWLRVVQGARVSCLDLSPASRRALAARGFATFDDANAAAASDERFDLVLCADSLGEIHADEDDWLADPENAESPDYAEELEARYGFAAKLEDLRPLLAPAGEIRLFEPVPLAHFWHGAARALEARGWRAEVNGPSPAWGLRITPSPSR
jgi:SAM-dependent methyltransferase